MKKIKITELPQSTSNEGLYTIGVDSDNKSVKIPLSLVFDAAINAQTSAANAATSATQAVTAAKSTLDKMATAAGAIKNADGKTYSMNGLTDITAADMYQILFAPTNCIGYHGILPRARTNAFYNIAMCAGNGMYGSPRDLSSISYGNTTIEIALLNTTGKKDSNGNLVDAGVMVTKIDCAFIWNTNLRRIIGDIMPYDNTKYQGHSSGLGSAFRDCAKLEHVHLRDWNFDVSFAQSPLLELESLEFLVNNKSTDKAISVTLHADCFARLTDTLIAAAQAKNISFISA